MSSFDIKMAELPIVIALVAASAATGSPSAAPTGEIGGIPLSNGDIIPFPVENLAHSYVYGAAGDGVIFTVTNTE